MQKFWSFFGFIFSLCLIFFQLTLVLFLNCRFLDYYLDKNHDKDDTDNDSMIATDGVEWMTEKNENSDVVDGKCIFYIHRTFDGDNW